MVIVFPGCGLLLLNSLQVAENAWQNRSPAGPGWWPGSSTSPEELEGEGSEAEASGAGQVTGPLAMLTWEWWQLSSPS